MVEKTENKKMKNRLLLCLLLLTPFVGKGQNMYVGVHSFGTPTKVFFQVDKGNSSSDDFKNVSLFYALYSDIFAEYKYKKLAFYVAFGSVMTPFRAKIVTADGFFEKIKYVVSTATIESSLSLKYYLKRYLYASAGIAIAYMNVNQRFPSSIRSGGGYGSGKQSPMLIIAPTHNYLSQNNIGPKFGIGYRRKIYKKLYFDTQVVCFLGTRDVAKITYNYKIDSNKYQTTVTTKGSYVALQVGLAYLWAK